MSTSSLTPAAAIVGSIGLTATAGSFCLFCENGDGGLFTVTSVSLPGGVAAARATGMSSATATTRAARTRRFILSPFSRNRGSDLTPTLDWMAIAATTLVRLDRGYVRVAGPDAADMLERMLSNDVASLAPEEARQALLLTPKSRLVAPLRVVREDEQSCLLIAEARARGGRRGEPPPGAVRGEMRDRGEALLRVPSARPGRRFPQRRLRGRGATRVGARNLSRRRIRPSSRRCGSTRARRAWGRGSTRACCRRRPGSTTHVSFTKGCYPGQEPVARLHYRGRPNRRLRRLEVARAQARRRDRALAKSASAA